MSTTPLPLWNATPTADAPPIAPPAARTLANLMSDGFSALNLVQNGAAPGSAETLADHLIDFLGDVERRARQAGVSQDDIWSAKYAFSATADEIVRSANLPLHARLFGEPGAGEQFFERLADLRTGGAARLQALEVFHLCLLLGFKGRYARGRLDQLHAITATLGVELAALRGKSDVYGAALAPHAERPDQLASKLRAELPAWLAAAALVLGAVGGYAAFWASLDDETGQALSHAVPVRLTPNR